MFIWHDSSWTRAYYQIGLTRASMLNVSSRGVFGLGQGFLAFESSFFGLGHILDKKIIARVCSIDYLYLYLIY